MDLGIQGSLAKVSEISVQQVASMPHPILYSKNKTSLRFVSVAGLTPAVSSRTKRWGWSMSQAVGRWAGSPYTQTWWSVIQWVPGTPDGTSLPSFTRYQTFRESACEAQRNCSFPWSFWLLWASWKSQLLQWQEYHSQKFENIMFSEIQSTFLEQSGHQTFEAGWGQAFSWVSKASCFGHHWLLIITENVYFYTPSSQALAGQVWWHLQGHPVASELGLNSVCTQLCGHLISKNSQKAVQAHGHPSQD